MAIKFSNIKNHKLGLMDTIRFGKFDGCRVCDILPDSYDYVLWLRDKFTKEVILDAEQLKRDAMHRQHQSEEVDPWFEDGVSSQYWEADPFDDVPF